MQALAFCLYYSTYKIIDIKSIIKVLITIVPIFLMSLLVLLNQQK